MPPEPVAISGATRTFALLGRPVHHSRSPWIHNRLLRAHGIDAVYVALDVDPARAAGVPMALRSLGLSGVNLTVPLKEAVLPELDVLAPSARRAGAANVVVREGRLLVGHNTDGDGFVAHIKTLGVTFGAPAIVLGAGGAGRAVTAALLQAGVPEVHLLNRSVERAESVAVALAGLGRVRPGPLRDAHWTTCPRRLVVNAVSGGGRPAVAGLSVDHLPRGTVWSDLNYWDDNPPQRGALRASGHHFDDGWGMLVGQAVKAFTLFTGVRLSLDKAHALLGPPP